MKVQSVTTNQNTFKAKILPKNLQENIGHLMSKMDADMVILQTKEMTQTIRVRSLDINGEAKFKDGRYLAKRDKNKKLVPYGNGTYMIEFGKVKFVSDSEGNVIFHKKPLFTKWKNIFAKAEKYIQMALDNYKNDKIVVKNLNRQEKLTPEGKKQIESQFQAIMNLFNKLKPTKG